MCVFSDICRALLFLQTMPQNRHSISRSLKKKHNFFSPAPHQSCRHSLYPKTSFRTTTATTSLPCLHPPFPPIPLFLLFLVCLHVGYTQLPLTYVYSFNSPDTHTHSCPPTTFLSHIHVSKPIFQICFGALKGSVYVRLCLWSHAGKWDRRIGLNFLDVSSLSLQIVIMMTVSVAYSSRLIIMVII